MQLPIAGTSPMVKEQLLQSIADNPQLPTFPPVALKVLEKASQPNCSIGELNEIISKDAVLCGKILRVANSAMMGMTRAVKSIKQALNLLGIRQVRSLVLTFAMPSVQSKKQADAAATDYWKVSLASALIARELAVRFQDPEPETEMVAGLLCDLGILILQELQPEQMTQIRSYPAEMLVTNRCALEESILGINHAEVSAYVLNRWHLPPEITEPIRCHHRPGSLVTSNAESACRSYLLCFATKLAELQVAPNHPFLVKDIVQLGRERFSMDEEQLKEFLAPITDKMTEFAKLMQVDVGACVEFPSLLSSATETLTALAYQTSIENLRVLEETKKAQSEWKKAEVNLRQAEEQMQQAKRLEAVGHLASGIAHDFRNYLTVISGYCDLLVAKHPAPDPSFELIDQIRKTGEKASGLIAQLLTFCRRQEPSSVSVNLNNIIRNMDKVLRCLLGERSQLEIALDPDLPAVAGNPGQIDQVIMNLVINARDAMNGVGKVTIRTATTNLAAAQNKLPPGTYVSLAISDTGSGMDEETRARIFQPFFTTKEMGKGSGLGLATVQKTILDLGGDVSVDSKLGAGTTFNILIPILKAPVTSVPKKAVSMPVAPVQATILVAEDEELVRGLACRTLASSGFKILEARNGLEAVVVGEEHKGTIDLLFTDAIMPLMPGSEVAKKLKSLRPDLKVLYTTAHTPETIAKSSAFPPDIPCLPKPFTPQALVGKIREMLQV